jgi:excinuclease ABC subunit B
MSEDLTEYLQELGIKVRYLHSEIDTIERMNILRDLRKGVFDVLIGINLLREGLDIPEVSLVAILDADKEGFLRSARSLIQTIGRAARNVNGTVILYADQMTRSIDQALGETNRRRAIQLAYNEEHGITPETVKKKISDLEQHVPEEVSQADAAIAALADLPLADYDVVIGDLRDKMQAASKDLRFEEAAKYRDEMKRLEQAKLGL